MTKKISLPLKLISVSALALALVACSDADDLTSSGTQDSTIASTEQRMDESTTTVQQGIAEAGADAKDAAASVGTAIEDATITAMVKAELAKDDTLKATDINVDTKDGRVHLQGTAPDNEARERATRLVTNVKGVINVDNALTVGSSS